MPVREKPQMDLEEYHLKLEEKGLTPDGASLVPDPTPIAPPLGYKRQPSMVEHIRNMVKSERLRAEAESAGAETFEEADDFDVEDDPLEPNTPYEDIFEPLDPSLPAPPVESTGVPSPGGGEGAGGLPGAGVSPSTPPGAAPGALPPAPGAAPPAPPAPPRSTST